MLDRFEQIYDTGFNANSNPKLNTKGANAVHSAPGKIYLLMFIHILCVKYISVYDHLRWRTNLCKPRECNTRCIGIVRSMDRSSRCRRSVTPGGSWRGLSRRTNG